MKKPSLVILVPAYNEEVRIQPTLERFGAYVKDQYDGECLIVVVLNGCRDRTLHMVEQSALRYPFIRWINFEAAIGKGGALIEGLKLARNAEYIGYVDADGATGPESFFSLVELCRNVDCVVGSRRMPGSVIHQSQPTNRLFASKVFHFIVELLFRMGIHDTQCGAKVIRREAVLKIHKTLHIADMAFDINLLYSLKRAGCMLLEAPVEWTDHIGSKVRYFRTSLVMFLSVVRLRLVHSPLYPYLRILRPIEARIYKALRNPPPRSTQEISRTTDIPIVQESRLHH